jgi:HPt (histidine-containing phosphotransfer) domain-containing protein
MPKPKERSALVEAAAAVWDELRAFANLASEAKREPLDSERSMSRTTRALSESVEFHPRIEEKLRTLVAEIDAARQLQQASVETLVQVAHEIERRAKSRDALLTRFAELGSRAGQVNTLAVELATRQKDGATGTEMLERLGAIEVGMEEVASEAHAIAGAATTEGWPEIARQADGLGQQMQSAKNKLALAHRDVASRAPS